MLKLPQLLLVSHLLVFSSWFDRIAPSAVAKDIALSSPHFSQSKAQRDQWRSLGSEISAVPCAMLKFGTPPLPLTLHSTSLLWHPLQHWRQVWQRQSCYPKTTSAEMHYTPGSCWELVFVVENNVWSLLLSGSLIRSFSADVHSTVPTDFKWAENFLCLYRTKPRSLFLHAPCYVENSNLPVSGSLRYSGIVFSCIFLLLIFIGQDKQQRSSLFCRPSPGICSSYCKCVLY